LSDGDQVWLLEASADRKGTFECLERGVDVALLGRMQGDGYEDVAPLHAVLAAVIEDSSCTGQPSVRPHGVAEIAIAHA
jgi:hypothetical protein